MFLLIILDNISYYCFPTIFCLSYITCTIKGQKGKATLDPMLKIIQISSKNIKFIMFFMFTGLIKGVCTSIFSSHSYSRSLLACSSLPFHTSCLNQAPKGPLKWLNYNDKVKPPNPENTERPPAVCIFVSFSTISISVIFK